MNHPKQKSICSGCRDDYYNQNSPEGCWSFESASVVARVAVGIWQNPPYLWEPQVVLTCYAPEGRTCLKREDCRVVEDEDEARRWLDRVEADQKAWQLSHPT